MPEGISGATSETLRIDHLARQFDSTVMTGSRNKQCTNVGEGSQPTLAGDAPSREPRCREAAAMLRAMRPEGCRGHRVIWGLGARPRPWHPDTFQKGGRRNPTDFLNVRSAAFATVLSAVDAASCVW
jgi:hypothetical protein